MIFLRAILQDFPVVAAFAGNQKKFVTCGLPASGGTFIATECIFLKAVEYFTSEQEYKRAEPTLDRVVIITTTKTRDHQLVVSG